VVARSGRIALDRHARPRRGLRAAAATRSLSR
jgi:hypothetical protein